MTLQHRSMYEYFTKVPLSLPSFSSFCLNLHNSITIVPIDMNLVSEQGLFKARESSSFTTGVPAVIGPSHTLVYELGSSN